MFALNGSAAFYYYFVANKLSAGFRSVLSLCNTFLCR